MSAKEYEYWLPSSDGNDELHKTTHNSIILIGANGTGKSRLGVWMEKKHPEKVYRIGAQRSLNFGIYINQKSYEQATNLLIYGTETPNESHDSKYSWDGKEYNYVTNLFDDYENVLSAVYAQKNIEVENFRDKTLATGKIDRYEIITEKLIRIWKSVFPHRNISFKDGKITVSFEREGDTVEYVGRNMSDGERVALYLMCQAMIAPQNSIVIIDEPELHLHKSIMTLLWESIEKERSDCLFIYITHDTQFAGNHANSEKKWIKSFDGNSWVFENIEDDIFPENLKIELLGNRKPVLFVEGETQSYDTKIYQAIYGGYYVVPCGGCSSVVAWTKAFINNTQMHDKECYGIIDRDYRNDNEIEKNKQNNIYTCEVAEVENLLITEEMIRAVAKTMALDEDKIFDKVKKYVVEDRFCKQIDSQVCQAVVSEIKFQLGVVNLSNSNESKVKEELETAFRNISFDDIKNRIEEKFSDIAEKKVYSDVIRVFNEKKIAKSIGHFFGLKDEEYCDFVVRQIQNKNKDYITAIKKYLPPITDIPEVII